MDRDRTAGSDATPPERGGREDGDGREGREAGRVATEEVERERQAGSHTAGDGGEVGGYGWDRPDDGDGLRGSSLRNTDARGGI